jgi:hypothetical protein
MRKKIYLISLILLGLFYQNTNGQVCPDLICAEAVRVSADNNCEAEIIPEYFVLPDCIFNNFQISISDLAGNPVPNPVTSEYFYSDLVIEFISFDLDDTCTTNLIVEDRLPPEINGITGPPVLTCLSNLDEVFTVDASDNCDFTTEITDISYACNTCFNEVSITWTATDIGNNQDSWTLTRELVGFWDVIIWPPDFIIACEGELPSVTTPVINDQPGCEREFIVEHFDYRTGCSINRQWIITDVGSGLQTSYYQHILINDIVEPVIIADDEIHLSLKEFNAGWDFDYTVVDDCTADPIVYLSQDIFPISCNPEYFKIIYTITAEDECGNQATHQTIVHVKSKQKTSVKLSGKKSCYSPFMIKSTVKNMTPPLSYQYSVNNFTWSITDLGDGRAMVNPGIGKVTIQVLVTDQVGCTAQDFIKYSCRKFIPTPRNAVLDEVKIYPNPSTGKLFITGENVLEINFFDIDGRWIKAYYNIQDNVINISELDSGLYIVKIKTSTEETSRRLIKM